MSVGKGEAQGEARLGEGVAQGEGRGGRVRGWALMCEGGFG